MVQLAKRGPLEKRKRSDGDGAGGNKKKRAGTHLKVDCLGPASTWPFCRMCCD